MDYTPLISEYANFVIVAAIALAVSSTVFYFLFLKYGGMTFETTTAILSISLLSAVVVAAGAVVTFCYAPNVTVNTETVKSNVEAKYDVAISNVNKVEGDDDASVFAASIVSNRDQSAYSVTVIIAADGTPSIVNAHGLDAQTLKR